MQAAMPLFMEVDAVAAQMTHALRIVRHYRSSFLDADPLLSCLALGMEKLAKLTIGLIELDDQGRWETRKRSHNVSALESECRDMLWARLERATPVGYLTSLMQKVSMDPVLLAIIATVTDYGMKGRYFYLDTLEGNPPPRSSPHQLWERVNQVILDADPELLQQLASADSQLARDRMNTLIIESIDSWWELFARCWQNGVAGPTAKILSSNIRPAERLRTR